MNCHVKFSDTPSSPAHTTQMLHAYILTYAHTYIQYIRTPHVCVEREREREGHRETGKATRIF